MSIRTLPLSLPKRSPVDSAPRAIRRAMLFAASLCILLSGTFALAATTPDRITQAINPNQVVTLHDVHPLAKKQYDTGRVKAGTKLNRMILTLKMSSQQKSDLDKLLKAQQDKSSPQYHKWLTPEQFGTQFGPSKSDIAKVTGWLKSQGFTIDSVAKGGTSIQFSGTSSAVESAFQTEMHSYAVNGEKHIANAKPTSIPQALTPVVGGVKSLNDFRVKSNIGPIKKVGPNTTLSDGSHALSPGDFYTIYNVSPLYSLATPIDGSGQTIAVVGRSNINTEDISDFRTLFGLAAPKVNVILNGPDPGESGDVFEQILDVSWSGAIAPKATVDLVVSESTETTDGVDLSTAYIIDNNLASVMTTSYSECEAVLFDFGVDYLSSLNEQASAQGITALVSTGDAGGAACDSDKDPVAYFGFAVNGLASTPYTLAVGGTQFSDVANPSAYWSATNSDNLASALSYIPEAVWNESSGGTLFAGGGGVSNYYFKPDWQTAATPADGGRDIPDVSLTASGHDGYIICAKDFGGDCSQGYFYTVGGTSASTPSFAGIMALVNQQTASQQGLANPTLYSLAASKPAVFHDTTAGDNKVPAYDGTTIGYAATTGYDLASGLGSVDVNALVTNWAQVGSGKSTLSLTATPTHITHGSPVTLAATLTQTDATLPPPTGDIAFLANSTSVGLGSVYPPGTTEVDFDSTLLPGGTNAVTARYTGDANFASITSAPVTVTVDPEASVVSKPVIGGTGTIYYGSVVTLTSSVSGASSNQSTATGKLTFQNGGTTLATGTLVETGGEIPTADDTATVTIPAINPNTGVATTAYLGAGFYSITANYPGDASYLAGVSAPAALTISQAPMFVSAGADHTQPLINTTVNLQANVSYFFGGSAPVTGTVSFYDAGVLLGTATLGSADPNTGIYFVTLPVQFTTLGIHPIGVVFSGDANTQSTQNQPAFVNVTVVSKSSTVTTVVATPAEVLSGSTVTLSATVKGDTGSATHPTGTVTFYEGAQSVGTGTLSSAQVSVTVPASALTNGVRTFSASYSGDANFAPSTSLAVASVTVDDYTFAIAPSSVSVVAGGTASTAATITYSGSLTTAVSFACSGLPSGAACSFTPSPVSLTNGTTTVVVEVSTSGDTFTPAAQRGTQHASLDQRGSGLGGKVGGGIGVAGVILLGLPAFGKRRRRLQVLLSVIGLIAIVGLGGCGSSTKKYVQTGTGTPVGNSTVTVTATAGSDVHTATFTLQVVSPTGK